MAMPDVTDEYGLVNVNEYLTAIIPATKKALIFRVMSRINAGNEEFNYGALPITVATGKTAFTSESAGTWGTGIIGGESYNTTSFSFTPPSDIIGTFDTSDMWYLKKEYRKYIFHTIMEVTPAWLQIEMEIPKGVKQGRFQNDQGVQTGVGKSFGYTRGKIETIFIPELHVGFRFGNDTNIDAYTNVKFTYAEDMISIPTDPNLIFEILTQQRPSHWITLPINNYDGSIVSALKGDYGFEGFPIFDKSQRNQATAAYAEIVKTIHPEVAL